MTDLDYITFEMESIAAQHTIVGYWIPNEIDIHLTDTAS
jgi:hypothetical protein